MTGSIYLIGGGEIRNGETYQIDEELKSLAPAGSSFVFFNFAAQDSVGYSETITSVFGDKYTISLPKEEKGRNYALSAIKSASLIYLGGGDTHRLMHLFSEWDLVESLTAGLKRGVHIAGMSAGALALCSWYIHEDKDVFELKKGWGLVPVVAQVHANQNSFQKAKSLLVNFDRDKDFPFIAIGEKAAWRINTSGEQKIGSGDIWKMYC